MPISTFPFKPSRSAAFFMAPFLLRILFAPPSSKDFGNFRTSALSLQPFETYNRKEFRNLERTRFYRLLRIFPAGMPFSFVLSARRWEADLASILVAVPSLFRDGCPFLALAMCFAPDHKSPNPEDLAIIEAKKIFQIESLGANSQKSRPPTRQLLNYRWRFWISWSERSYVHLV